MPVSKTQPELVELEVTVDNHTHAGELCKKGARIKVMVQAKEMLEGVWADQAEAAKAAKK